MIPRKRNTYYKGQLKDAIFGFRPRLLASGEITREFERAFAERFGFADAVATCTGRDGLLQLLSAHGMEAGDEIVVPAYTLGELVGLLKSCGYVPVLADVDGSSYQLTVEGVEPRITERTRAILATHLFGWPCDIANIVELAQSKGIIVIEDCAHALGGMMDGRALGSFGDGAFYSLEQVKPINTFGGGLVVAKDSSVIKGIREAVERRPTAGLSVFKQVVAGILTDAVVRSPLGGVVAWLFSSKTTRRLVERAVSGVFAATRPREVRYSDYQAMMGLKALENLPERNEALARLYETYREDLPDAVSIPPIGAEVRPAFFVLVARTPYDAGDVKAEMLRYGVEVGIGSEIMDDCSKLTGDVCPNASVLYRTAVQLPFHPRMTDEDALKVCRALGRVLTSLRGSDAVR